MAGAKNDGGLVTDINVTPLVDVVLVLLVLMMVTATALASRTIPVQLPTAASGADPNAKQPLVIAVDEAGAIFLDKRRVDEAELRAVARDKHPESAILAADGRARHDKVVRVLDLLRSERVMKVAIVVRAVGEGGGS